MRRGLGRSRWWLDGLRQAVDWLRPLSLAGVHRLLGRLGIHYKRGRRYVHSPDPAYVAKVATLGYLRHRAEARSARITVLYADEMTYARRPTVAQGYALSGRDAPRADQGLGSNTHRRIAACVDVQTGRLFTWQRAHFAVATLLRCYQEVEQAYPDAQRLYLVQDNWPVHFHAFVREELAKHHSRIELLPLPTYAPWTNPTEKVWGLLAKDVLNQHEFLEDWPGLQRAVADWLAQYEQGSQSLLHTVGLCPH